MSETLKTAVMKALDSVIDPTVGKSIVMLKSVSFVDVKNNGDVVVVVNVDPARGTELEGMRQEAERKVHEVDGVANAQVILTAEHKSEKTPPAKRDPHPLPASVTVPARNVIVVASGKGGVGKSTVSANLAVALAQNGKNKVGLLDADIYGPSQPVMFDCASYKPKLNEKKQLIPIEKHGVKMMSIGFIANASQALIWRGPMVQTAFIQLIRDVAWMNEDDEMLDYLVIDLPPGTGDVQLTMAQKIKVDGAVIVSTPQDIALIDARRAVKMFEKTNVPVLGLIENMSTHICSNCGHEEHIFGHGGGKAEAEALGISYLGDVPLSRDVREQSDAGTPIVLAAPDSAAAKSFHSVAQHIFSQN